MNHNFALSGYASVLWNVNSHEEGDQKKDTKYCNRERGKMIILSTIHLLKSMKWIHLRIHGKNSRILSEKARWKQCFYHSTFVKQKTIRKSDTTINSGHIRKRVCMIFILHFIVLYSEYLPFVTYIFKIFKIYTR